MPLVKEALSLIEKGHFSNGDGNLFTPIVQAFIREALGNKGQKASHAFLLFGLNY